MSLTSGLAMLHTPPFRAILVFVATFNSLHFNLKPFRLLKVHTPRQSYLKLWLFVDFLCKVGWNCQWLTACKGFYHSQLLLILLILARKFHDPILKWFPLWSQILHISTLYLVVCWVELYLFLKLMQPV